MPVTAWALMIVPLFALLVAFTIAVTLLTSSVNVFYRDVNPVVQIGLQLWLYRDADRVLRCRRCRRPGAGGLP